MSAADVPDLPLTPPLRGLGWDGAFTAAVEAKRQDLWRAAVRRGGQALCPAPSQVFAAFDADFERVSVVIVGQDPYPRQDHAIGVAFGVPAPVGSVPIVLPATLRNIACELADDVGCDALMSSADQRTQPRRGDQGQVAPDRAAVAGGQGTHGSHGSSAHGQHVDASLSSWTRQGVLLLNRVLTCEAGKSWAHEDVGWQLFTDAVVDALVARGNPLVAILWGKQAQQLRPRFHEFPVIETSHPSPLSAYRGFRGSRPFTRSNALLARMGHPGIHWC